MKFVQVSVALSQGTDLGTWREVYAVDEEGAVWRFDQTGDAATGEWRRLPPHPRETL